MADDIDMEAPQISTLRETPEPNPARSKFRVKLLVSDKTEGLKASFEPSKHGRAESDDDEEEDEEEEEEDQLIDDDEEDITERRPAAASAVPSQVSAPPTRGSPGKRGGRGRGRGKGRGSGRAGAPVTGPGVTWFETTPSEATTSQEVRADVWEPSSAPSATVTPQAPGKKKPGPPKGTPRVVRKKASKIAKGAIPLLKDDADSVSEAYGGTAASSPMPHEPSPEPDIATSSISAPPVHIMEDTPLDGVPLPVYPLPSKPFPVQPPPKVGTGFAPVIPLDKSGKSVRKWRQVNREVRGIAGGRWFVKSWVGEKDSEFASAIAASQVAAQNAAELSAGGLSLPKLPAVSISGTGRGRGRGARHGVDHVSAVTSRAGSALPESVSAHFGKKRGSGPSTPAVDLPTPVPITAPPAV